MLLLPVIDLLRGLAVHGRAGRREDYQVVCSKLCPEADGDPVKLAFAMRQQLGVTELYIADLDAITGERPNWEILRQIQRLGIRLWLDAGIKNQQDVREVVTKLAPDVTVIVGLETLRSLDDLGEISQTASSADLVVSLDLFAGRPLTSIEPWKNLTALEIASRLRDLGYRKLILLDLSRVGMSSGTGTERLIEPVKRLDPGLQVLAGGGIQGPGDLARLRSLGCDGVLIATTLHDGRIGAREFRLT